MSRTLAILMIILSVLLCAWNVYDIFYAEELWLKIISGIIAAIWVYLGYWWVMRLRSL